MLEHQIGHGQTFLMFPPQAASSRFSLDGGSGVQNIGVSSSLPIGRHGCIETLEAHPVDETHHATVHDEILVHRTLRVCPEHVLLWRRLHVHATVSAWTERSRDLGGGPCCLHYCSYHLLPPYPFGQKGLSILTVLFPAVAWASRLLSGGTWLEVIAISILCQRLPQSWHLSPYIFPFPPFCSGSSG